MTKLAPVWRVRVEGIANRTLRSEWLDRLTRDFYEKCPGVSLVVAEQIGASVTFLCRAPAGTSEQAVRELLLQEAERTRQQVLKLWNVGK